MLDMTCDMNKQSKKSPFCLQVVFGLALIKFTNSCFVSAVLFLLLATIEVYTKRESLVGHDDWLVGHCPIK